MIASADRRWSPRAATDVGESGRPGTIAGLLRRYLSRVAVRATCEWRDQSGRVLGPSEGSRGLASIRRDGSLVVTYWIADCLGFALLPFVDASFRPAIPSYRCLVDDTFGGRIVGHYVDSVGARHIMLPLPGAPDRLLRLQQVIAEGGTWAFPVDGGGPYGEVGTGIVSLALALKASILPVSFRASRSVPFPHPSGFRVPLPGCRLAVCAGTPIVVDRRIDRRQTASVLKNALDDVTAAARTCRARDPIA